MNTQYIKLIKTIYNQKEFVLEPLGLKLRKVNSDALASWLYPLLEFSLNRKRLFSFPLNKKYLARAYTLYHLYKQKNLKRVGLFGGEYKAVYKSLLNTKVVYEDGNNKTIFGEGVIYVTVKCSKKVLFDLLNKGNVFYIVFNFNRVYFDSGLIKQTSVYSDSGKYDFKKERFSIRNALPFTYHLLIESLGFTRDEHNFVMLLSRFPLKEQTLMLAKANTKKVQEQVFANAYI